MRFSLGHKLPGGFYGRAYFGGGYGGRRRRTRRAQTRTSVIVHLNARDLVAMKEQQRKDSAASLKGIFIFIGVCLLAWPPMNLSDSPFPAWPLFILEILVGLCVFIAWLPIEPRTKAD